MKTFLVQMHSAPPIEVKARWFLIVRDPDNSIRLLFTNQISEPLITDTKPAAPRDFSKEVAWFRYENVVYWRITPQK